jgi:putative addiction module CopG family antidote
MALTLSPEVEHRLEIRVQEGRWKSASDVVGTALDLLDDLDDLIVVTREDLQAKIQDGLDSVDRGELYTSEEVRAHLAEVRARLSR